MIRTLLVDDEALARDRLQRLLELHRDIHIVGQAGDGLEALSLIETLKPDLIFLDIQMPVLNGLQTAKAMGVDRPAIIFATAHEQYAIDAFETAALDYLLKPISADRLERALDRLRHHRTEHLIRLQHALDGLQSKKPSAPIAVKSGSKYIVIDPTQLTAVIAEDHYSILKTDQCEVLADESLDTFEQRLGEPFIRIHRSSLINLDRLASLDRHGDRKYFAVMKGRQPLRLPVSRGRLAQLKQILGISK